MTIEEFNSLTFRCLGNVSARDYHTTTYFNSDYGIKIVAEYKLKDDKLYGNEKKIYTYKGKKYSKKKFYREVLKDIEYKEDN